MFTRLRRLIRRAFNLPGWERGSRRIPTPAQWGALLRALTFRERILAGIAFSAIIASAAILIGRTYLENTAVVPAEGGNVTIGVVGRPLYLNPVLAPSNPADEDLVRLLFAGLFRYDGSGRLVPDLAVSFAVGDFGKTIDVVLKDNVQWPDGEPFTADDVVFTANAIRNPAIRSPLFAAWSSVGVEALDHRTVRFTLPSPYPPFLHNLAIGILPKHYWEDVAPENFALSDKNLEPLGLGPFAADRYERTRDGRILSYTLKPNPTAPRKPFLESLTVRFFDRADDAIIAFNRREVQFIGPIRPEDTERIRSGAKILSASLPRTFALFLNQTASKALADATVRKALAYATDRRPILASLGGDRFAKTLERPVPEGMFGATADTDRYDFSPEHARNILETAGWKNSEGDGARKKGDEPLNLTLAFREGDDMRAVAETLQAQWRDIGVALEIRSLEPAAFRQAVRDRDYQILLAGQELPADPDPYAFWHSSQKFDPGGNLALYDSDEADTILEESRNAFDDALRAEHYAAFQRTLMRDAPAIFLWQGKTAVAFGPPLRGIETTFLPNISWRFGNADQWYVQTKREWR